MELPTVVDALNGPAELKSQIVEDVRALECLHSRHTSGSAIGMFGPSRSGNPSDPFEMDLGEVLRDRGLELVRRTAQAEMARGDLSLAMALAIAQAAGDFIDQQWRRVGSASILHLMRAEYGVPGLRQLLLTEAKRIRQEGLTRAIPPSTGTPEAPSAAKRQQTLRRFPDRAAWLEREIDRRKWSTLDVEKWDGPDHKTVKRILDGLSVRRGSLKQLAAALTVKGPKVNLDDMPTS